MTGTITIFVQRGQALGGFSLSISGAHFVLSDEGCGLTDLSEVQRVELTTNWVQVFGGDVQGTLRLSAEPEAGDARLDARGFSGAGGGAFVQWSRSGSRPGEGDLSTGSVALDGFG